MANRIILPNKRKEDIPEMTPSQTAQDPFDSTARSEREAPISTVPSTKGYRFFLPTRPVALNNVGFERGANYVSNLTFSQGNNHFQEGELLEVIGSRKFGPMAALEIVFRDTKTGTKKFYTLHHNRHDYYQSKFTKVS